MATPGFQTVTTATGDYTIPLLPPGSYRVTVEVSGFKKFVQTGIRAEVAQTARLDIKLEIGSASESVTVQADGIALETTNGDYGQTVTGEQAGELQLNGRNFPLSQRCGIIQTNAKSLPARLNTATWLPPRCAASPILSR